MKDFLRNVENPNDKTGRPQPLVIDIEAEEVSPSNEKNGTSGKNAPPAWFKNLKEDFIADQIDVRPLNKSHHRRPKSLRSLKLQPKKKVSSVKLLFGVLAILILGFFAYQFSFPSKAIALPSHVNEPIGLNHHIKLSDRELKGSLSTFLEDFYARQSAGNFEFANYFSDKTELYYSEENPSIDQIKDAYNKRFRKMNNLQQHLVSPSLKFYRNGSEVILTYWVELNYQQKLYNKQESAEVRNEMIINESGKIISLKQVEIKNFSSSDIVGSSYDIKDN
ncbi:MAG: energy transducer TonB [Sphingobacteriales bacterium]|nr:energy transducer TonB [Sphingobacteriales bacterium]